MKKVILFLITLLSVTFLHAQTNENNKPLTNEEFFTQAEIVFEGYLLKTVDIYDSKGNDKYNSKFDDCYSITAYIVQQIYKGPKYNTGDTLFIVFQGGLLFMKDDLKRNDDGRRYTRESYIQLPFSSKIGFDCTVNSHSPSIYFLVDSDFPDDINSEYATYKKYKHLTLHVDRSKEGCYNKMHICRNKIIGLDSLFFHQREDFYSYISHFEGFTVPVPEPIPEIIPLKRTPFETIVDSLRNVHDATMDSILKMNKEDIPVFLNGDKKKALKETKSHSEYNTLTLHIANQQVVEEGDKQFVEFDILASSNNPNIYFSETVLYLVYDPDVFGPDSLVNKGKVIAYRGEHFNNNEDYPLYTLDYFSSNMILVGFYSNYNSLNRVTIDSVPTVLLHFEIELLPDANYIYSHLHFLYYSYVGDGSAYTLTSNAPNSEKIYYNKTFFYSNIPMITTNLSSLSKVAGIGDILTINGTNFGNERGNVYFTAADDGGLTYLQGLDSQYYVTDGWSDSQIQVMAPSLVYDGYTGGNSGGGAGSGQIKIKTTLGDSCVSVSNLHIPYSICNENDPTDNIVRRVYLPKLHCDYDILFMLHHTIAIHPQGDSIIKVVKKGLRDWSALTGLNLALEIDSIATPSLGKYNIVPEYIEVELMEVIHGTSVVTIGANKYMYCPADSKPSYIKINPTLPLPYFWNFDTINGNPISDYQFSFYQAFMHELGHVLLLEHVNQSSDLMYYKLTSPDTIKYILPTDTVVLAVKKNIADSRAIPWPSGFVKTPKITILGHNSPLICNEPFATLSSNYPTGNLWSTGATTQTIQVSATGVYWLKANDLCGLADTVSLTFSNVNATFTVTHVACYGENTGSIITQVTGTHPPYTYQWTGNGINVATQNISNLTSGTYYLSLSNSAGCTKQYTVTVSQPEELTLNIVLPPNPIGRESYQANVTGGTPPYTYIWQYVSVTGKAPCNLADYLNSPIIPTSCETATCKLKLVVTDSLECQVEAITPRGEKMPLNNININNEVRVIPNPTSGSFTITNIQDATLYLYSAQSAYMNTFEHITNNETINISYLPTGIYFLKIIDGNTIKNEKLILYR